MKISHISIYSLVFISFFYASSMFSEISEAQEKLMEKLPPDTRALLMQRMEKNYLTPLAVWAATFPKMIHYLRH